MDKFIEIPFGAFDSELKGWEYTIPEGMEAKVENGKIVVREKDSIDSIILDALLIHFRHKSKPTWNGFPVRDILTSIERLKNRVPPQDTEKEYIRTIKSLIADFIRGKDHIDTVYYQKIYDWLDGRHVEEQNQTEWSENDEKMIDKCVELVLCAMPANMSATKAKEQCIAWLKSLQPRLKQEDRYTEGYRQGFAAAEKAYKNAVSYHMDNPNVYKLDPNVVIDSTTGGTHD